MWRLALMGLALALGLAATPAAAMRWVVVPAESRIVFEYEADGTPTEGAFTRFDGSGRFDPAAPGAATLELRIESASIDLGDPRADAVATSAEWFDSANHPHIVYRLTPLTPLGGDRHRAAGTLEIDRRAYLLGVGPISLFVDIGRWVAVRFELVARPTR